MRKFGGDWGRLDMRSEWNISTLSHVCLLITDGSHFSPKSVPLGKYMVSVKDFTSYGFDFSSCRHISEEDYETLKHNGCVPQANDILVGKDGARFFEDVIIYKQPEKPALLSSIAILRCNTDIIIPEFLYYILKNPLTKQDVRDNYGSGSAIPRIVLKDFRRMPVSYPALPEQRAIAAILSCLDDKIELNNKVNANLEAQAQAIFKSWFVDFEPFQNGEFVDSELGRIPKGWQVGKLSDIAEITMGQSPKGESYNENGEGIVFYQGRGEFSNRFPVTRLYTTEPKRMAKKNDILMSVRAPVGDVNIAKEDCCIGRGLAAIRSNSNNSSFLLYLMLNMKAKLDTYNGEGTVFGSINKKDLHGMKIVIPQTEAINDYDNIVQSVDKKIFMLCQQNQVLVALRDTLLPKLMSGEIEVSISDKETNENHD